MSANLEEGTSLILAISTLDGIVMAADSRVGITWRHKKIGYHDSGQKLFNCASIPLGLAFSGSFEDSTTGLPSKLIHELRGLDKPLTQPYDLHTLLRKKIEMSFPPHHTVTLVCGYDRKEPFISFIGVNPGSTYPITKTFGFVCQYQVDESNHEDFFKNMHLSNAVAFAQDFVRNYSQREEYWKGIGGEVDVLVITPQRVEWACRKTCGVDESQIKATLKHYQEGRLRFMLFDGFTETHLRETLAHT
jgi:20S proteasome alpha/beta subunit